jgi:hypothetical protein
VKISSRLCVREFSALILEVQFRASLAAALEVVLVESAVALAEEALEVAGLVAVEPAQVGAAVVVAPVVPSADWVALLVPWERLVPQRRHLARLEVDEPARSRRKAEIR